MRSKLESDGYYQHKRKKSGDTSVKRKEARDLKTRKPSVQIRQQFELKSMGTQTTEQTKERQGGLNRPRTIVQNLKKEPVGRKLF